MLYVSIHIIIAVICTFVTANSLDQKDWQELEADTCTVLFHHKTHFRSTDQWVSAHAQTQRMSLCAKSTGIRRQYNSLLQIHQCNYNKDVKPHYHASWSCAKRYMDRALIAGCSWKLVPSGQLVVWHWHAVSSRTSKWRSMRGTNKLVQCCGLLRQLSFQLAELGSRESEEEGTKVLTVTLHYT